MDQNRQQFGAPTRPSARIATMPNSFQRGSYGVPPRQQPAPLASVTTPQPVVTSPTVAPVQQQSTPVPVVEQPVQIQPQPVAAPTRPAPVTPTGPRYMDVAPVMNVAAPQTVASQPMATQPITAAPQRPLFTPTPAAAPVEQKSHRHVAVNSLVRYSVLSVGVLLMLIGAVRWVQAGSTANDTIAVGAVSANDGRSMTIQFTATDGLLHKYTTASDRDMIPGSATEIAYRSGAPEATARQVSSVKSARTAGMLIVAAGICFMFIYGIISAIHKFKTRGHHRHAGLTTALSA